MPRKCIQRCVAGLIALAGASPADAQDLNHAHRPLAANVIVPQTRAFSLDRSAGLRITLVAASVGIVEQVATTTIEVALANQSDRRQQAELILPVPDGAAVGGFAFEGKAHKPTAEVLPKAEAQRIYEGLVAKTRDPALVEFIGYNLVRSSVFPVEARGTQKIRLTYSQVLPATGDRVDYYLPRSESLDYDVPWTISVKVRSQRPISTIYSPSHRLETRRIGSKELLVKVSRNAAQEPGPFRLSYLLERNGLTATLLAYPDAKIGGGYFLLLAGLPAKTLVDSDKAPIKREVTLALDRSGSMRGEKMDQVREAAMQVIAGLEEGEAFNLIVYQNTVESLAKAPVLKGRKTRDAAYAYLEGITAGGGTNIHDALLESLRPEPAPGMLPIVLFLTDGVPTVRETSEVAIRNLAIKANPHNRRVFTFGVGVDVNTPLLEKIASATRARATFVLPGEDVEVAVSDLFKQLAGPVLADARLDVLDKQGRPAIGRTRDLIPAKLPDLFEGNQLVLLGQYIGNEPITFRLGGNYLGRERAFQFSFDLDQATIRNNYVPRLWASRRIAVLVDAIRQMGANGTPGTVVPVPKDDPAFKELIDEIVRLSTEFGILTEYTAFLAREGTDFGRRDLIISRAEGNFRVQAMGMRSGVGSMAQSFNNPERITEVRSNGANVFYDANMEPVEITSVQQVSDRAFYHRRGRWVDSRVVDRGGALKPSKVIQFGSKEFMALARRLAGEGRQSSISLPGDIVMLVDQELVLVKAPSGVAKAAAAPRGLRRSKHGARGRAARQMRLK